MVRAILKNYSFHSCSETKMLYKFWNPELVNNWISSDIHKHAQANTHTHKHAQANTHTHTQTQLNWKLSRKRTQQQFKKQHNSFNIHNRCWRKTAKKTGIAGHIYFLDLEIIKISKIQKEFRLENLFKF